VKEHGAAGWDTDLRFRIEGHDGGDSYFVHLAQAMGHMTCSHRFLLTVQHGEERDDLMSRS
jgi:hypothetical protein